MANPQAKRKQIAAKYDITVLSLIALTNPSYFRYILPFRSDEIRRTPSAPQDETTEVLHRMDTQHLQYNGCPKGRKPVAPFF